MEGEKEETKKTKETSDDVYGFEHFETLDLGPSEFSCFDDDCEV